MVPSLHFIPSHRENYYGTLEKLDATTIIFDLEDGVPEDLTESGRNLLIKNKDKIESLNSYVRISKIDGCYNDSDIEIINSLEFKGVVIPKVESVNEISHFFERVNDSKKNIKLLILIESFKGLEALKNICETFEDKVAAVGLGLEDFLSAVPIINIQDNIKDFIRLRFICIAKAFNIQCIDTVSLNFNDKVGTFNKECIDSKNLLFDGRFSIHPTQISVINDVYSPSEEDVDWAKSIVQKVDGKDTIGYKKTGGEIISPPKVKKALLILTKAGIYNG